MSEGASVLMSSWPLLIGLGGLSGFLSGLLGIGGGAVIVPALVFALPMLGVEGEALPKIAIATSVAIMIPTAIASAQHHGARGFIDGHSAVLFAPSVVLGAFAAGFFAERINTQLICLLFVLYMLHIARGLARRTAARKAQPGSRPSFISFTVVGVLGGGLSALLGQGSASYAVPFMARFADLRAAIGTAAALNIPLAAAGVLGYLISAAPSACGAACVGYVHLPAVAAISISAVLAAPAGALLTQALPVLFLRRLFALVLAVSAANLAAKTLPLAEAPVYVAAAVQRLQSSVAAPMPVAALPPVCLVDPTLRTAHLVAEYGPRQLFAASQGDCLPPATISAALSLLRSRAIPPAEFWSKPAPKAKVTSSSPAVAAPPKPSRGERPRVTLRKPIKDIATVILEARTDPALAPRIDHQDAGGFDPFGFRSPAAPRPRPQPFGGDR
jgi:uncharacterized membrane protein YfcA